MTETTTQSRVAKLLAQVRMVGRFGWLGGYTHAVLTNDGAMICARCVHDNYRCISWATRHDAHDGWQAMAVFALDSGPEHCDNCGQEVH